MGQEGDNVKGPSSGHPMADKKASASTLTTPAEACRGDEIGATLKDELVIIDQDVKVGGSKSETSVGCWVKLTTIVKSIWTTTDLLSGQDRIAVVRTSTRQFAVYLVFLGVLIAVTNTAMNPTMYNYTKILGNLFGSVDNVGQIKDFWAFMQGDFLNGVYWESNYNDGTDPQHFPCPGSPANGGGPCPIPVDQRQIMYANQLLGVPRMRMLRVRNDSCTIPPEFKDVVNVCYNSYSKSYEDKSVFKPNYIKHTSFDAWRYQTAQELDGSDHWGLLATYSGAGSVQSLSLEKARSSAIIQELKEGIWIRRGVRYVVVDFTLYNANVNLFCIIKLNFEFPPTGGVLVEKDFLTVKLIRYITDLDYGFLGCELVFTMFIAYYFVEEALEIRTLGFGYFKSFWNLMDCFLVTVSASVMASDIYKYIKVTTLLKGLLAEPDVYTDFSYLGETSRSFQILAAFTIFVGLVKIFKFISFNKTMSQLSGTLSRMVPDLATFSIMFVIVYMAFGMIGYLQFGSQVKGYSSLVSTSYTQLRTVLGDFNFLALQNADPYMGPIYFFTFIFLVFFILLNMFLAIINDTYSEVKAEVEARQEEYQMADFIKAGYNNLKGIIGERDKLLDIQNTIKLTSVDGVVTFEEIRESLKRYNFSDAEIDIFCAKVDLDSNAKFTLNEIIAIEGENSSMKINKSNEATTSVEGSDDTMRGFDGEEARLPTFNQGMFELLEDRVDAVEEMMTMIAEKINSVLDRLDNFNFSDERRNFGRG